MNNEIVKYDDDVPAIADDTLIRMANEAEARIDAVMKIKRVALKVTNARDWTDQNGNPYLQVSGSEKIANLFNISWRIEPMIYEEESDGHFTYSGKGVFSLGGRTIEVEGTRSSKDPFFKRYKWIKVEGRPDEKVELPPSAIDKGDVKKAALTNLYGNGITRILGIRNLTWADLEEYAGIKKEDCGKVEYKGKPPVQQPQSKSEKTEGNGAPPPSGTSIIDSIEKVDSTSGEKDGKKWTKYSIHAGGFVYGTFDKKIAEIADQHTGMKMRIHFEQKGKFLTCTGVEPVEATQENLV